MPETAMNPSETKEQGKLELPSKLTILDPAEIASKQRTDSDENLGSTTRSSSVCRDREAGIAQGRALSRERTNDQLMASAEHLRDEPAEAALSPMSCDSQLEFAAAHQTVLIFDWDDTLCPSTFCRTELKDDLICRIWRDTCMAAQNEEAEKLPETTAEKLNKGDMAGDEAESPVKEAKEETADEETYRLNSPNDSLQKVYVSKAHRQILAEISEALLELIQSAQKLGKVVIVTNAETGWIELSCRAWLPSCYKAVMQCDLVSARSKYEPEGVTSPAGWKARAFHDIVDIFYGRTRSWKNIISIGDAPHEREAIFRITADNKHPKCRTKSIKLLVKPQPQELLHQLSILQLHLDKIVALDNGLDIEFDKTKGSFS